MLVYVQSFTRPPLLRRPPSLVRVAQTQTRPRIFIVPRPTCSPHQALILHSHPLHSIVYKHECKYGYHCASTFVLIRDILLPLLTYIPPSSFMCRRKHERVPFVRTWGWSLFTHPTIYFYDTIVSTLLEHPPAPPSWTHPSMTVSLSNLEPYLQ